jgi:hypothetical protein
VIKYPILKGVGVFPEGFLQGRKKGVRIRRVPRTKVFLGGLEKIRVFTRIRLSKKKGEILLSRLLPLLF